MSALTPALILLVVSALAGLYTSVTYRWLGTRNSGVQDTLGGSERLGLSIILAVLFLAVANNYLSALVGSVATAVVLLAAPLCHVVFLISRRGPKSLLPSMRPTAWRDAAAAAVTALFLLSAGHKLLFWGPLSPGAAHPDLLWHVARAAEQAFVSSPGFWPLSPIAFPGPLPFYPFVADTLVAVTFRYLPIPIHAYHYSQILFCWSIVLWTAVALVAGSGLWRSLAALTTAIFVAPLALWGIGRVGINLLVFFFANPNSLIAWPIGLALTLHLFRHARLGSSPSLLFLLLVAPTSLFFKANQAFGFGFLQAAGFLMVLGSRGSRVAVKWGSVAAGIWAVTILLSFTMGQWPPSSTGIHPSIDNLNDYAFVAFPAQQSWPDLIIHLLSYALILAAVSAGALLVRSRLGGGLGTVRQAIPRDVVIPLVVLFAFMAYLLVGWWLVVPNRIAEGEPMHVNAELLMWIGTAIISGAVCSLYDNHSAQGRPRGVRLWLPVSTSFVVLGVYGFMVWSVNYHPSVQRGRIPLDREYDTSADRTIRELAKAQIPDGHCFWYGRRYAIYVKGDLDPDSVIAITGCPVINGRRWRGYFGDNDPELVKAQQTIRVRAGDPFTLVEVVGPTIMPARAPRAVESLSEVSREVGRPSFVVPTETRNWALDPAGFDLEPPFATRSMLRMYVRVVRPPLAAENPWLYLYRDGETPARLLEFRATSALNQSRLRVGDVTTLTFPLTLNAGLYQAYAGSAVAEGSPVPLGWILVGTPGSPEFNKALESIRQRGNGERAEEIARLVELFRTGEGAPANLAEVERLATTLATDDMRSFVRRSRSVTAGLVRLGVKSSPKAAARLRRLWLDAIAKQSAKLGIQPEPPAAGSAAQSPGELSIDSIAVVPNDDNDSWTVVLLPQEGRTPACSVEGVGILVAGAPTALERLSSLVLCDGKGDPLPVTFVDVRAAPGLSATATIDVFLFSKRLTRKVAPVLR